MKKKPGNQAFAAFEIEFPKILKILCLVCIPLTSLAVGIISFFLEMPAAFLVLSMLGMSTVFLVSLFFTLNNKRLDLSRILFLEVFLGIVSGIALLGILCCLVFLDISFENRVISALLFSGLFAAAGTGLILLSRNRIILEKNALKLGLAVRVVETIMLIAFGSFLYAISFPGFAHTWGLFPFAFIALVPVFIVINRIKLRYAPLAGILFGILAHFFMNYWLAMFHPLAITVALAYRAVFFCIAFTALKAAIKFFPRWGIIIQSMIWVGYEYLTSLGFSGYSYGFIGYTQYLFGPLLQTASLGGVWLVSFIVIFPSALLAVLLSKGPGNIMKQIKQYAPVGIAFGVVFIGMVVFGILSQKDYSQAKTWKTALVQSNVDPWKGGDAAYESYLRVLLRQSKEAITHNPDIVVWPETALVPSVRFHSQFRFDQIRYNRVVKPFLEFMDTQDIPYLIGNVDGELKSRDAMGNYERNDYNAAVLFKGREIQGVYRKTHLVPYTEHFPYKDLFPEINQWLLNADTHFWEKGSEEDAGFVFNSNGVNFSTPICFEDTFGYLPRRFVQNGAEVIVNITNDSWSNSVVAEMQHFAIAIFRSVENRRSTVRSTASGITAAIDPDGKILAIAEPFEETYLIADVPVISDETTLYTLWGDWFGIICAVGAGLLLLTGAGLMLKKKLIPDTEENVDTKTEYDE